MTQETIAPGSWRIHLLVTGGVLFTVLLALLLAQLDSLQRQILPSPVAQAISNLNATPTNTLLPAIPLATGTPAPPASSTPANGDLDTAVAVLPACNATPPGWALTPISSGETLLAISLRYNISEEKIRLANCLEPGSLVSVTALYLPVAAATPAPIAEVNCGPPRDWELYTVRPGDNVFRLSLRFGTTISAILNANCLTTTNIQVGQRLYLPPRIVIAPTPTATATATGTATATTTATATGISTPTSTVPPLPTSSATATSTATGTATNTPTVTATASSTPTASVTASVTNTPSASPTVSPTATGTPSSTPTPSPTSSATPTASATPSPTLSPTPSSTSTATATPTATATATETPVP